MTRVLVLGGTAEAAALARTLAAAGVPGVFSYAGRTAAPASVPIPTRVGGFGGSEGLAAWIRAEAITHVVDATHPFAAMMSRNVLFACATAATPLIALERMAWTPCPGDAWTRVSDVAAAAAALPDAPARVFLAIGRQQLEPFAALPQHRYLLRLVDPPDAPPLPGADVVVARGPFEAEADRVLMQTHAITHVVAKNAGGTGARAKLDAARMLGLPVIMVDRPALPSRATTGSVAEVMAWLGHLTDLGE